MTTTLVLAEDDVYRFKNKKAVDVFLPRVFITVLEWGCEKEDKETIEAFLIKSKPHISNWKKYIKDNFHHANSKLQKTNFRSDEFDVSFLYCLIPEACRDIAPKGNAVWSSGNDTKLECLLKTAKELRNVVCHGSASGATDPSILDQMEEVTGKLLKTAGNKYSIDEKTVTSTIKKFRIELSQIRQADLTDKEKISVQIEKNFREKGRNEMEKRKRVATLVLPFSQSKLILSEIFHGINLIIRDEDKNGEEVQYCDLLDHLDSDRRVGFIIGEAGTGKSSHLRRMIDDYLENDEKEIFKGVRQFPVVLYFECRNTTIRSCKHLLEQTFPDIFKKIKNVNYAINVLRQMGLLILIDGLDETNKISRKVLDELLDKFVAHGNATFILGTRPSVEHKWTKEVQGQNLDYVKFYLKPINDKTEQEVFLMRYGKKILGTHASDIIRAFRSLNLENPCETYFCYPIYLVLFCYLYKKTPSNVKKWKNELNIMDQFLKLCKENVIKRLNGPLFENRNVKTLAGDVLSQVSDLCLRLALKDEMVISDEECAKIVRSVFKDLLVECQSIFSCFFLSRSDQEGFQFLHKSQCEFMASRAITKKLRDDSTTRISSIIAQAQVQKGDRDDLNRLLNVYRFVVMALVESGDEELLKRSLGEICEDLTKKQRTPFEYWAQLTDSCPSSEVVTKMAAKAAKLVSDEQWTVTNPRAMAATLRMLVHEQPLKMTVSVLRNEKHQEYHDLIPQNYKGGLGLNLENSYWNFIPSDDLLSRLSSSRCYLTLFKGCLNITSAAIGKELVAVIKKNPRDRLRDGTSRPQPQLFISLAQPRQHQLSALSDVKHSLKVRARLCSEGSPRLRCPLPQSSNHPTLFVVCSPGPDLAGTARTAADLIQDLAPPDFKFRRLRLQHWQDTEKAKTALVSLVEILVSAGLQTQKISVPAHWKLAEKKDGHCSSCQETNHQRGEICVDLLLGVSSGDSSQDVADLSQSLESCTIGSNSTKQRSRSRHQY